MKYLNILSLTFLLTNFLAAHAATAETMDVYKSPSCGCCSAWVKHIEQAGFNVVVHHVEDVMPIKAANGLPTALASCHTALMDGYVFEGHVPASDIERFLKEKPNTRGLAVPGMPAGENVPGMEVPGRRASFASYLIPEKMPARSSDLEVFATHR